MQVDYNNGYVDFDDSCSRIRSCNSEHRGQHHPEIRDAADAAITEAVGWRKPIETWVNNQAWSWPTLEMIHYVLELHEVRFISVTQQFDTQHVTGRRLRSVLATFARSKRLLAWHKAGDPSERALRGCWVGGTVPFGYQCVSKR